MTAVMAFLLEMAKVIDNELFISSMLHVVE